MDYIDDLRERFSNDVFATKAAGIVIDEAAPGYAKCSFKISVDHMNAAGSVMGGAIFTLADFAFAVAANGTGENGITVSLASQITFLEKPKGTTLTAEASCVKAGRTSSFYTVDVTDDAGSKVAAVTVNGCNISHKF